MKIHVSELEGAALSYAVAIAQGYKPTFALWCGEMVACEIEPVGDFGDQVTMFYEYHDRWDQCGQLIEKYDVWLCHEFRNDEKLYTASTHLNAVHTYDTGIYEGRTAQVAICRAVVAVQLGDEVEIPDELVEQVESI